MYLKILFLCFFSLKVFSVDLEEYSEYSNYSMEPYLKVVRTTSLVQIAHQFTKKRKKDDDLKIDKSLVKEGCKWKFNISITSNLDPQDFYFIKTFPLRIPNPEMLGYDSLEELIKQDKAFVTLNKNFETDLNRQVLPMDTFSGEVTLTCSRCFNVENGKRCDFSKSIPLYVAFFLLQKADETYYILCCQLVPVEPMLKKIMKGDHIPPSLFNHKEGEVYLVFRDYRFIEPLEQKDQPVSSLKELKWVFAPNGSLPGANFLIKFSNVDEKWMKENVKGILFGNEPLQNMQKLVELKSIFGQIPFQKGILYGPVEIRLIKKDGSCFTLGYFLYL